MIKEELEKEAEEKFKVNNKDKDREHFYDRMWFKTGYLAGAEPREEHIEELEKENERLKGDLELWESGGCRAINLFECGVVKELKEQLTKAKEILEKLANLEYVINPPAVTDKVRSLMVKAEQFLKGENIILKDVQAGNNPFDADEVFNKEIKAYPEEKVK